MKNRHWHYFSIEVSIARTDRVRGASSEVCKDINQVMHAALHDYGIGLLSVADLMGETFVLDAQVCCSTRAKREAVITDLFTLITERLFTAGYRFDSVRITHDLTEPDFGDNPHAGPDKFATVSAR